MSSQKNGKHLNYSLPFTQDDTFRVCPGAELPVLFPSTRHSPSAAQRGKKGAAGATFCEFKKREQKGGEDIRPHIPASTAPLIRIRRCEKALWGNVGPSNNLQTFTRAGVNQAQVLVEVRRRKADALGSKVKLPIRI